MAVATLVKSIAGGAALSGRPWPHSALRNVLLLHPLSLDLPKALRGQLTATATATAARLVLTRIVYCVEVQTLAVNSFQPVRYDGAALLRYQGSFPAKSLSVMLTTNIT